MPDQFAEAEKELSLAVRSAHADENIVQLYLGKLYGRTGEFDKSIAAFNAYLERSPQAANAGEVRVLIARMEKLKAKGH